MALDQVGVLLEFHEQACLYFIANVDDREGHVTLQFESVGNKGMEVFQGIDLEHCTGKDFVQAVLMVEFHDLWLSTTSLLDLEHNLQVNFLENQNDSK